MDTKKEKQEKETMKTTEIDLKQAQANWQSGGVQWRKDHEICECGDYRHEHENGTGKCLVCKYAAQLYEPCQEFRAMEQNMNADKEEGKVNG